MCDENFLLNYEYIFLNASYIFVSFIISANKAFLICFADTEKKGNRYEIYF